MFAFLFTKANSKKICKEISFPSFFKKMLMSVFLLRFRANYLEKMHGYPVFLRGFNNPCKDLFFLQGPDLAQNPL